MKKPYIDLFSFSHSHKGIDIFHNPLIQKLDFNEIQLQKFIGRGGFADVYK